MAKTLLELVEGWTKSPADKKFEKMHSVEKTGKEPEVKTKKYDRKPRDGYEPGEDEEVYKKTQKEEVEYIDEADMMQIKVGEKVRLTNPKAPARHTVTAIKGNIAHIKKDSGEEIKMPLNRIKKVKHQASQLGKGDK